MNAKQIQRIASIQNVLTNSLRNSTASAVPVAIKQQTKRTVPTNALMQSLKMPEQT